MKGIREAMALKNRITQLIEDYKKTHKGSGKEGQVTQVDIAHAMNIDPATLSRYKSEYVQRYDSDVLEKVCKFFKVPLTEVLYMEEEES
jgi:transcriptional regulator with XRE-family HTH domain